MITYIDKNWGLLFVQDSTAGIFVNLKNSVANGDLQVGRAVEMTGVTAPGDLVPSIDRSRINVRGFAPLPAPIRPDVETLSSGRLDSQWAEISGVVRYAEERRGHLYMNLDKDGSRVKLNLLEFPKSWITRLPDAEITVRGVISMAFNKRRQVIGASLDIPGSTFVKITRSAPDPYSIPESPLGSLGQFSESSSSHRVHVRGTVEAVDPASGPYVSDGADSVAVRGHGCVAAPGDLIEVIGFSAFLDYHRTLEDAICRKTARGVPHGPRAVDASSILADNSTDQAADTRNDMSVIETDAKVLQVTDTTGGYTVLLESGETIFPATMPGRSGASILRLQPGTEVRVTGFCLIKYDSFQKADSFRLLLRSLADIKIISRPSWWNVEHTFWVVGVMAALIGAVLFWVGTLRRRVEHQTSIIRSNLQHEVKLETRYRRLFEANLASALTLSADGTILDCNPAFAALLGAGACAHLIGRKLSPTYVSAPQFRQFFADVHSKGSISNAELKLARPDGTEVLALASGLLIEAEDNQLIIEATLVDVSAQRRFEQELIRAKEAAEAASRLKSEFLANMSHEIRTPLNGVLGMTSLALSSELNSEVREYLETAYDSAGHLLTLLNDVLDYSKIEAAKLVLENTEFDARDVVRKAVRTFAAKAREKGLELLYVVQDSVPEVVVGDPHRLQQVLLNLIGNAIKFTEKGAVIVSADRMQTSRGSSVTLEFSVQDSGLGIEPEKQAAIFKPFTQADGSTTRKYGGTGLGLSICSQLVSLMHGEISVSSAPGQGSCFSFTCSLGTVPGRENALRKPVNALLRGRDVVLDVENSTARSFLREVLFGWGMNVIDVADGDSILSALWLLIAQGSRSPVVLLDGTAPASDRFEIAAGIREEFDSSATVILFLDSVQLRDSADRFRAPEVGYLVKPIDLDELRSAFIRSFLSEPVISTSTPNIPKPVSADLGHNLSVLVAEDNAVNQKLICTLLRKAGHRVELVTNGRDAVSAAASRSFDVILMDVQMPNMDGFEATAAIRNLPDNSKSKIPVIAVTAHALDGYRDRCLAAGMNGYITKPIDAKQLASVLEELAEKSTASRAIEPAIV
ncbi:MAG: response regulator [Acidobacteriaceae bacterium]|nr:response regulator [Acidobacteriaceae bacterium]